MTPPSIELVRALAGESALVVGALVVLGFDLGFGRRQSLEARWRAATLFGLAAIVAAAALVLHVGAIGAAFGGGFMLDTLGVGTCTGVLVLAALTLLIASGTTQLRNPAEFVAIVLFATTGFMLMAIVQQLLLAFLAIELASLSLYVLVGFDKTRPESAEAALKYFLVGGMSAAFLLFGFSLLYGVSGSIDFDVIGGALERQGLTPLMGVALVMVIVAFGFKAAAAPFHLWAPDAYQGAPTTAAALIASASKLAGFTFFVRLLWPGLGAIAGDVTVNHVVPGWVPIVGVLSAASLLVGNFGALAQSNLRRLLAYSAIAHAGVLLLGVMAAGPDGPGPLFYYASTYGLATVGAFGVVAVLERAGVGPRITDLAGLHQRSPLLAGCLAVFILSLAGIPPLAGFFGKFAVFAAALQLGGISGLAGWLTLAAIFLSAVALYYYLIVLKHALVAAPDPDRATPIAVSPGSALALVLAAVLLVVLGTFPSLLLGIFS
ncbi:MAG TPA: NADH-quinone oxidoreductase subunit N [Opitutaceae bacterium]|nr:NADH-quinone oxidoreductase subunit N [Opitutaceae bacterium]